jgi:hypothetical protein
MSYKFAISLSLAMLLASALPTPAFSDTENAASVAPWNLEFLRNGSIGNSLRRSIMDELKNTPYFYASENRVLEVFRWDAAQGKGVIVAVRAGTGKAAGCAIYEKFAGSGFEFVTGQPYCSFSNPSGKFYNKSLSIKFIGKLRQSSDSPVFDNWFELFYDKHNGIFCYPESRSQKFKCSGVSS